MLKNHNLVHNLFKCYIEKGNNSHTLFENVSKNAQKVVSFDSWSQFPNLIHLT